MLLLVTIVYKELKDDEYFTAGNSTLLVVCWCGTQKAGLLIFKHYIQRGGEMDRLLEGSIACFISFENSQKASRKY